MKQRNKYKKYHMVRHFFTYTMHGWSGIEGEGKGI